MCYIVHCHLCSVISFQLSLKHKQITVFSLWIIQFDLYLYFIFSSFLFLDWTLVSLWNTYFQNSCLCYLLLLLLSEFLFYFISHFEAMSSHRWSYVFIYAGQVCDFALFVHAYRCCVILLLYLCLKSLIQMN